MKKMPEVRKGELVISANVDINTWHFARWVGASLGQGAFES